jgi:Sec-independent protein secretion pathway component TatC
MSAFLAWFIAWLFVKMICSKWNTQLAKTIQAFDLSIASQNSLLENQFEATLPMIDAELDHFFNHKLGEKMPMIAMFIGAQTTAQLKAVFIEELKLVFPKLVQQIANGIQPKLANHIQNKWKPILEPLLFKATRNFRLFAILLGGIWGFLMLLFIHHA